MNTTEAAAPAANSAVAFAPASAAQYRRTLQQTPADFGAWFGLSGLDDTVFDAAETRELERLHGLHTLDATARIITGFALAHALEDQDRYAEAFSTLGAANSMRRRGLHWHAAGFSRGVDATMQAFAKPSPQTVTNQGGAAIFLVGMPCAGADIVECILSAHPDVGSANAHSDLGAVIEEVTRAGDTTFAAWAGSASDRDWQRLGEHHVQRTAAWRGKLPRFLDDTLSNWRFVGAIASALPAARIIDVRRDPLETCLGCYRKLFAQGRFFSYDIDELIACWRDYERLMQFWNNRDPGRIHRFSHEHLIADPKSEIRRLLAGCDLPFDEACVTAFSARAQARPIAERVAGYGGLLMPLRLALGMAPT